MKKYFDDFKNYEDMKDQFSQYNWDGTPKIAPKGFPTDDEILFAAYGGGSYEGWATVVFKRDGQLWLNDASHCSCYGLEEGWNPVKTEPELLLKEKAYDKGDYWGYYSDEAHDAFRNLVHSMIGEVQ